MKFSTPVFGWLSWRGVDSKSRRSTQRYSLVALANIQTGILFVIRGDTFNKVWKCVAWNIHIVAGGVGSQASPWLCTVIRDFPAASRGKHWQLLRSHSMISRRAPVRLLLRSFLLPSASTFANRPVYPCTSKGFIAPLHAHVNAVYIFVSAPIHLRPSQGPD